LKAAGLPTDQSEEGLMMLSQGNIQGFADSVQGISNSYQQALQGSQGVSVNQRERQSAIDILNKDPKMLTNEGKEAAVFLGLRARASKSAQERIAEDEDLAKKISDQKKSESEAAELGKLGARLKLEPEVRTAVDTAANNVKVLADQALLDKTNESTFNVYNAGMNGVVEALGNTDTGPFVGRLFAVTANQQIAEGAVAAVAPVLKQLFRSAGEGNFTDADQKLLMEMVPTRKDRPEAVKAKLSNIDAIVRARLSISGQSQNVQAPKGGDTPPQVIRFDAQGNIIQ
jgi:hypothetical protein